MRNIFLGTFAGVLAGVLVASAIIWGATHIDLWGEPEPPRTSPLVTASAILDDWRRSTDREGRQLAVSRAGIADPEVLAWLLYASSSTAKPILKRVLEQSPFKEADIKAAIAERCNFPPHLMEVSRELCLRRHYTDYGWKWGGGSDG